MAYSYYSAVVSNLPNLTFSFTVPEETPTGYYRARYMLDWNNADPCYYGNNGDDNGEFVSDFYIKVNSYGTVTLADDAESFVELDADNVESPYHKALSLRLLPLEGNVDVTAYFATQLAAITDLVFDGSSAVEVYTLQGVKVSSAENLKSGFYIMRQGNKSVKVYINKR